LEITFHNGDSSRSLHFFPASNVTIIRSKALQTTINFLNAADLQQETLQISNDV
jgi:hypothetical protein